MNKKVLAVAIATLMILGMLPALIPAASATTTMQETVTPKCIPYQSEVTNLELDIKNNPFPPFCVFLHPGVTDSYKTGWSHTLDTLWGMQAQTVEGGEVPGTPTTNGQTREVFDKYLDYAILASSSDSIGDLQFDLTFIAPIVKLVIYVPPEFTFTAKTSYESIWTDITNDYNFIAVSTRNEFDGYAPHWTRITIGDTMTIAPTATPLNPVTFHVRLFSLRAPTVVGLYFFKIYYRLPTSSADVSLGAGNYPITIVKGELNPAYVLVNVRTHDLPAYPLVSGFVNATGTTPSGRTVKAIGWWGPVEFYGNQPVPPGPPGALYRLYLFGLPAGTYTAQAQASGFKPSTSERFTLDAGQSFKLEMVIIKSADLSVTVWSKHGTGAVPWHNLWELPYGTNCPSCIPDDTPPMAPRRDIMFNLYDSKGTMVAFWGTDDQNTNTFPTKLKSTQRGIPLNNLLASAGLIPTTTNQHYVLDDNFDLLTNPRAQTSTNWEGHVPWDIPDYVQGILETQYTLEAYVTGYILDEADAYQRSFTVLTAGPGVHYQLQMDLRRTNWIENVIHLPSQQLVGPQVTVTILAKDAKASERGAAVFAATPLMALDAVLDGNDADSTTICQGGTKACTPNWKPYAGGIVIEGWNDLFPDAGGSGVRDLTKETTGTINANHKDYGLNPTPSAHSDQAVAKRVVLNGNPYTISLFMSDMGDPSGFTTGKQKLGTGWYSIVGGDPQVSVFLCNSPVSLSYSIVNASLWISLRSVDFEVPAHSRPWTFPGAEIWVNFMDMKGNVVDSLDPTIYGLFQDPGRATPPPTTPATAPIPNSPVCYYAKADGTYPGALMPGNWGYTPFDIDNKNCPGQHEHIGVWYFGTDYLADPDLPGSPGTGLWRAMLPAARSTRIPAGEYTYAASTYGYIQRRSFPMFIPAYGRGDIEADLIQGAQVRILVDFYDENVKTKFNGFAMAEVFNSKGMLVGASIYGQAQPNCFTRASDGTDLCPGTYHPYEQIYDWQIVSGPSQGTGLDGTPYLYPPSLYPALGPRSASYPPPGSLDFPSNSYGQRADESADIYGVPQHNALGLWNEWDEPVSSDGNRLNVPINSQAAIDVYGFYWYTGGAMRTWAGGWPTNNATAQVDYGIKGSVDIPGWAGSGGGLYTVKVWAFDPYGPNNAFEAFGATDDWRMFDQAIPIQNVQLPWGGMQEIYVRMDNMAKLEGTVRWFDMYGDLRPLPWAQISASNPSVKGGTAPGAGSPAYSSGLGAVGAGASDSAGAYIMWLPPGSHDVSISSTEASQIWSSAAPTINSKYTVVVQPGWVGGGDSQLSGSGTPVPEVPAYLLPLTLMAALAASVWLLRKKTSTTSIPVLMK